ncbi:MAG: tol-pal system protein YbgF [Magnetospiraceae bacterium]
MRYLFTVASVAVVLTGLTATAPAMAQDAEYRVLYDRISRLERDIRALNRSAYQNGGAPAESQNAGTQAAPGSSAYMSVRVGELETQIRNMTGQIERLEFEVRELKNRINLLTGEPSAASSSLGNGQPNYESPAYGGNAGNANPSAPSGGGAERYDPRFSNNGASDSQPSGGVLGTLTREELEMARPGGTPAPSTPGAPQSLNTPTTTAGGGGPRGSYEAARTLLFRQDWPGAESAFKAFITDNPEDPLVPNARYWLGETHYVRGDYNEAARVFLEAYSTAPDSAKAPDSLLKLGMSMAALGKKREACASFKKLLQDYSSSAPHIQDMTRQQQTRNGC